MRSTVAIDRGWVFYKTEDVAQLQRLHGHVQPTSWESGSKVLFKGRRLSMRVALADVAEAAVVYRTRFDVSLPRNALASQRPALAEAVVVAWLQAKLEVDASALVRRFARQTGVEPRRIVVRPLKGFWGSCSKTGIISLDSGLIRLPQHLIDYVVAHEVAHLVDRTHSRRFWALLDRLVPEMNGSRAELAAFPSRSGQR